MRSLPIEFTTELIKEVYCFRHLFVFEWSRTFRWTDCEHNIYYGGQWFDSRNIKFDSLDLAMNPKVDQVTLVIEDINRKLRKIILAEDLRDTPLWLYVVPLNKNLEPISTASLLFLGYFDAANLPIGEKSWSINFYNDMIKWRRLTPRRVTSPTCQHEFKHGPDKVIGTDSNTYTCIQDHMGHSANKPVTGADWGDYWVLAGANGKEWIEMDWYTIGTCKYAGEETTCDRSWDRCDELGNTENFGGFRWVTAAQGRQLWWGQSASQTVRAAIAYKSRGH
jgi:hypothetical protein